jgi:hypothetical protein
VFVVRRRGASLCFSAFAAKTDFRKKKPRMRRAGFSEWFLNAFCISGSRHFRKQTSVALIAAFL